MRIPLVPQLSTKDGETNKNARMTNALKESTVTGAVAQVRPGLDQLATTTGSGNGLVDFDGELVSIFDAELNVNGGPVFDTTAIYTSDTAGVTSEGLLIAWATTNEGVQYPLMTGLYSDGVNPLSRIFIWSSEFDLIIPDPLDESDQMFAEVIAEDGSVIYGTSSPSSATDKVFRWTVDGGTELAYPQPADGTKGNPFGCSSDGTIVCGSYKLLTGFTHACKWSEAGGLVDLGVLSGHTTSVANAISSDGTVIVGTSSISTTLRAFRWTQAGGMVEIATGTGNFVSSDGTVVIGYTTTGIPFRWTQAGGAVNIHTGARTLTAVNSTCDVAITSTLLWRNGIGWTTLPTLGGVTTRAQAISADGNIIVGRSQTIDAIYRPFVYFVWSDTMIEYGDETGLLPGELMAITTDGLLAAGYERNSLSDNVAIFWGDTNVWGNFNSIATLTNQQFDFAQST